MISIREIICNELAELIKNESPSSVPLGLNDSSVLLDSGVDSLGFAVLVTRLEMILGYDPFTLDPNPVYPVTLGDFIDYYEKFSHKRMVD